MEALIHADLADSIVADAPRVLVLAAPSGFGKTTLAQALAERGGGIVYDASRASDGAPTLWAQAEALLAAHRLLVLDNADRVDERGLLRFLRDVPAGRSVVVCRRRPLAAQLAPPLPADAVVELRESDLRFDDADAALLAGSPESGSVVARMSGGWPIAVAFLAQLARRGVPAAELEDLRAPTLERLTTYAAEHGLPSLEEQERSRLIAVMAADGPNDVELAVLFGTTSPAAAADLARATPFLERGDDGRTRVTAVVAEAFRRHAFEQVRDEIGRLERGPLRLGPARSAAAYLAVGDTLRAAAALERAHSELAVHEARSLAPLVAALPGAVLAEFPALWNAAAGVRTWTVPLRTLLIEIDTARERAGNLPIHQRFAFCASAMRVCARAGRRHAIDGFVDWFLATVSEPAEISFPYAAFLQALADALLTRPIDLDELEESVAPLLVHDGLSAAFLSIRGDELRRRGDHVAERETRERAAAVARMENGYGSRAEAIALSILAEWRDGDDAALARCERELTAEALPRLEHLFARFLARLNGRGIDATGEESWSVAISGLIGASRVADRREALALLADARSAALADGSHVLVVYAALATAALDGKRRTDALAEARSAAVRASSPTLESAIEEFATSGRFAGVLGSLVTRFRVLPAGRTVTLAFLSRSLHVGEHAVALPAQRFALLALLALRRAVVARDEILSLFWPNRPERESARILHVQLSAIRKAAGTQIVRRQGSGYVLDESVEIDFDRLSAGPLPDHLAATATAVAETVDALGREEPYGAELARLCEPVARRAIAELLERALSERPDDAWDGAQLLFMRDPTDEIVASTAIRAALLAGDPGSARALLRRHERALREEFGSEPSVAIKALIQHQSA